MPETIRPLTPQIAGFKTEQSIKPFVRVHLEFTTPECQRYWDEAVEGEKAHVAYNPEDDTYIIPLPFPLDILKAFHGKIIEEVKTSFKG